MAKSQLNLKPLRENLGKSPSVAESSDLHLNRALRFGLSRRSFLGFAGVSLAGLSLARPFQNKLTLRLVKNRAELRLGRKLIWAIDGSQFDGTPQLAAKQVGDRISIALTKAFYPGTSVPADLSCVLQKTATTWDMLLRTKFLRLVLREDFFQWAQRRSPKVYGRSADTKIGLKRLGFLSLNGNVSVRFLPEFSFELDGASISNLDLGGTALSSGSASFGLAPGRGLSLFRERLARRTIFTLKRGHHDWLLPPDIQASSFILEPQTNGFSVISIETGTTESGQTKSALLAESLPETTAYKFQPAPSCGCRPDGEPFSLDVANVRYAVTDSGNGKETALFGNLSGSEVWEHPSGADLVLGTSEESTSNFELVSKPGESVNLKAEPVLLGINLSVGDGACSKIEFEQPPKFACCLGKPSLWHKLLYFLHLSRPEDKLVLPLDGARLSITRPQDLLRLTFRFKGLALRCHKHKGWLVGAPGATERVISVEFPPQHVVEQAFFRGSSSKFENKNPNDPDKGSSSIEPPAAPGSVDSRLSGLSTLVFRLPEADMPYRLVSLLDWSTWTQIVSPAATVANQIASQQTLPSPERVAGLVTKIELPYRLYLSPHEKAAWINPTTLPEEDASTLVELWQTRLGSRIKRLRLPGESDPVSSATEESEFEITDRPNPLQTVRAIWSEDYPEDVGAPPCFEGAASVPFRNSLEKRDRYEFVDLSSNFELQSRADISKPYNPDPVRVEYLTLSSMGAWLKSRGVWDPPSNRKQKPLVVEEWRHIAQMGRDAYVRVMYKGYLFPFGHKASLVKLTERLFEKLPDGTIGAYLIQTLFILIREPIKYFKAEGQPSESREWPYRAVHITTVQTPPLDDPSKPPLNSPNDPLFKLGFGQQAFWPQVAGKDFLFEFNKQTLDGDWVTTTSPLVFVDVGIAFDECGPPTIPNCAAGTPLPPPPPCAPPVQGGLIAKICDIYMKEDARRRLNLNGQKVAYAPNTKVGGTNFETFGELIGCELPKADVLRCPCPERPAQSLREKDQPPFYPRVDKSECKIPGVSELTAGSGRITLKYFEVYRDNGFDNSTNQGEVYLQFETPLQLQFGGANAGAGSDKVGGVATPSTSLIGISRSIGPVGTQVPNAITAANMQTLFADSLKEIGAGQVDPRKYFGDAKILGGVTLKDIIFFNDTVFSKLNEKKAPQMIREVEHGLKDFTEELNQKLNVVAGEVIKYIDGLPPDARRVCEPEATGLKESLQKFQNLSVTSKPFALPDIRTALTRFMSKVQDLVRDPERLVRAFFPAWVEKVDELWKTIRFFRDGGFQKAIHDQIKAQLGQLMQKVAQEINGELNEVRTALEQRLQEVVDGAVNSLPIEQLLTTAMQAITMLEETRRRLRELQAMLDVAQQSLNQLRQVVDSLFSLVESVPATLRGQIQQLVDQLVTSVPPQIPQQAQRIRDALQRLEDPQTKGVELVRAQLALVENVVQLVETLEPLVEKLPTVGPNPISIGGASIKGPRDAARELIRLLTETANTYSWIRNAVQNASLDAVLNIIVPPGSPVSARLKLLKADLDQLRTEIDTYKQTLTALKDFARVKEGLKLLAKVEVFAWYCDKIMAVMALAPGKRQELEQAGQVLEQMLNDTKRLYVQRFTTPLLTAVRDAKSGLPDELKPFLLPVFSAAETDLTNLSGRPTEETAQALKKLLDELRGLPQHLTNQVRDLIKTLEQFVRSEEFLKAVLEKLGLPLSLTLKYDWVPKLQTNDLFIAQGGPNEIEAELKLSCVYKQSFIGNTNPQVSIDGSLTNFKLVLLPSITCVTINFNSVSFSSKNGSKPETKVKIFDVKFGEALKWVEELQKKLNPSEGPYLIIRPSGIEAGYRFAVPAMTFGAFNLIMLRIGVALKLPFTGDPCAFRFFFSDRARPFLLSSGAWGGGGFLALEVSSDKRLMIEGALEFGLVGSISIGFASGTGFVMAGIYFKFSNPNSEVCGFVHASGQLDILGLIQVTIDCYISLCYTNENNSNCVYGWAEISIKIEYFFFSLEVTLHAERKFAGGSSSNLVSARSAGALPGGEERMTTDTCCPRPALEWNAYRLAFA